MMMIMMMITTIAAKTRYDDRRKKNEVNKDTKKIMKILMVIAGVDDRTFDHVPCRKCSGRI